LAKTGSIIATSLYTVDGIHNLRYVAEYLKKTECMVPENIHTPTTEGIGNSKGMEVGMGVGMGSKTQKIFRGGGGSWTIDLASTCPLIQCVFKDQSTVQ